MTYWYLTCQYDTYFRPASTSKALIIAGSSGSANWQPELYSSAHFTVAETRPTSGRVNQMTEPTLSAEYVLSRAPLTEISETRHNVRRKPSSSASKPIADRAAPR
jgi:hypothetical protein